MYYVNQRNYPHIAYPTLTDLPERKRDTSVSSSGCGLCSASMLVTNLTGFEFSLADSLELSLAVGANHSPGTDMDLFAPYVAERFDLELEMTDDPEKLRAHMRKGYMAIANITGDRPEDNHIGLFSHGGHYVTVVAIDESGEEVTVLDPSQTVDKFKEEGRAGLVRENGFYLHTTFELLVEDCKYRQPASYPDGDFKAWLEYKGSPDSANRFFLFSPRN
ncbi:MAG: hypothetical protein LUH20_03270 [Lachnospiraceae bacterium]|nr:hypothetical protein [Lachnospiraceae bacterium]